MIDPKSASFPIYGAALAAGVDYEIALRWIEVSRRPAAIWFGPRAMDRVELVYAEGVRRHGDAAMEDLAARLVEAVIERRIIALGLVR